MKENAKKSGISLLNDSVSQKKEFNPETLTHREVYFRSGKIVSCNVNLFRGTKKSVKEQSIKNLELKGSILGIKQGTCSKLEKILTGWIKALQYQSEYCSKAIKVNKRLPVFVTLTLPTTQIHSDIEIKRRCLMPFLQECKSCYGLKYYFWKAETQLNGNIHFHLILDTFIHYKKLQTAWNAHLNSLDYINAFAEKHGHYAPPTTHVEILKDVQQACCYVLKYVTKDVEGRNIEGRKWMCSRELRNMTIKGYLEDFSITGYIDYLVKNDKVTVYHDEYFSVFRFTDKFDYKSDYGFIKRIEYQDCIFAYDMLYGDNSTGQAKERVQVVKSDSVPQQLSLFEDAESCRINWDMKSSHFS